MKALLLVCALAGTALAYPVKMPADPPSRAEVLEKAARDSNDPEAFVAAGNAYLDLYNSNPNATDGDEALYNAGVTFEEGHAVAAAIQAFTLIGKHHPLSKLQPRATARLGRLYGDIAMYDRAAEKLEEYATKYAGEKDARDAMSDAIYFRKAVGDRDKAIADTKYFIKTFGTKAPNQAADAMWSLLSFYENDADKTIKQLREYLKTFGAKGGAERVVTAHAKIGQLLWKRSCRGSLVDGLCVTSTENAKKTCGKGTIHTLVPARRDEAIVKEALTELLAAAREFEKQPGDVAGARYWYAQAKLVEADVELESFLAIGLPANLDFDPANKKTRESSVKRFDEWLRNKTKGGETASNKYTAVLSIKDAATSITAAERLALIAHSFASSLVTGAIPRDVQRGPKAADKTNAYCDALTTVAEPLEAKALAGFGVCLAKSTELSWFDESSRLCERELARIEPDDFPILKERHGESDDVAPVIASEPPPAFVAVP